MFIFFDKSYSSNLLLSEFSFPQSSFFIFSISFIKFLFITFDFAFECFIIIFLCLIFLYFDFKSNSLFIFSLLFDLIEKISLFIFRLFLIVSVVVLYFDKFSPYVFICLILLIFSLSISKLLSLL